MRLSATGLWTGWGMQRLLWIGTPLPSMLTVSGRKEKYFPEVKLALCFIVVFSGVLWKPSLPVRWVEDLPNPGHPRHRYCCWPCRFLPLSTCLSLVFCLSYAIWSWELVFWRMIQLFIKFSGFGYLVFALCRTLERLRVKDKLCLKALLSLLIVNIYHHNPTPALEQPYL